MKFCDDCGQEIYTNDGETHCQGCDDRRGNGKRTSNKAKRQKAGYEQALRDLGLVKVRGAMGGVYWE